MIPGMPVNQITPDQAPPLKIPILFFATGMVSLIAAGSHAIHLSNQLYVSNWMPLTLGFTHFGTLGFLTSIMMGAFYQMVPVVAGRPIPAITLAYATLVFHIAGTASLIMGLSTLHAQWLHVGMLLEGAACFFFLLPTGWALLTAPSKHSSISGMRLSIFSLLVSLIFGVVLGLGHSGVSYPGLRTEWLQTHLTFALAGWVGLLIVSVSWQVIPMFYMTPAYKPAFTRLVVWAAALGLISALLAFSLTLCRFGGLWLDVACIGLAILVWGIHPLWTLGLIMNRRRKNRDGSLRFWKMGLGFGFLALPVGIWALFSPDPKWSLLAGWLVVWGWAGSIVHGMLYRIVPFLLWFHRFSALVGKQRVPSMKSLLPESLISMAYFVHFTTVFLGLISLGFSWNVGFWLMGLGLLCSGLILAFNSSRAIYTAMSFKLDKGRI